MSLETAIKRLESKPLSGADIIRLCKGKVKILTYSELSNYKTIDEVLKPFGSVVILYRTSSNFGHWCGINKINKNTIEFFDPYAFMIDSELKWVGKRIRKELDQEHTVLSNLLLDSKYNIDYNHIRFQKMKDGINTCGRWCCMRTLLKHLTLEQFARLFKCKACDADFIVTYLTQEA